MFRTYVFIITIQTIHSFSDIELKIITQYNPGLYKINNILKIAFSILKNAPLTETIFEDVPCIVFIKPITLKDLISRPNLPSKDNQIQPHKKD